MVRVLWQEMVEDIRFDGLPVNWNAFDIAAFSKTKALWDYQRTAVENAIKALWKYYEDFGDYRANESAEANRERKLKFFRWYRDNGLDENLHIPLTGNHRLAGLLTEYYEELGSPERHTKILVEPWRSWRARPHEPPV